MEDLTVEEICRRINIQANLNDLQSKNKDKTKPPERGFLTQIMEVN